MSPKPAGVTWSAIVLGIITAILACSALGLVLIAFVFARNPSIVPSTPGHPAPSPGFMAALFGTMGALTLACVAWGATTVAGLVRLRNWARISIIVIGVCLAAFSLLELFGTFVSMLVVSNVAMPSSGGATPNADVLRGVMLFIALLWLGVAAVGVWWIVYFAKRNTRDLFHHTATGTPWAGQVREASPITDFGVAQPLISAPDAAAPIEPATAIAPQQANDSPGRPISMTVIAVLMFIAAANMFVLCLLPFPFFLFGAQMTGWSGHIVLLVLGSLYAFGAYGLLRRIHLGWLVAVGIQIVMLLNALIMLVPGVQERQLAYMQSLTTSMTPTMPNVPAAQAQAQALMTESITKAVIGPGMVVGVMIGVFFLVLMWRARWAYKGDK